ncbi:unnamed protein product [Ectocarpus sp. CCAP 1310/34]|nr:unnamed protein product [Ectocarpus sp. CCAP 1310/34]
MTSIFLGLMSVVGLLLVVLQSSSSEIQLGNTHLLAPGVPANEGCFKSEGAMLVCLAKAATIATGVVSTADTGSTPGTGTESALQIARSQMLYDSGDLPMTSRYVQLHDVTTPVAASPPAAVCHPDAHDAIDMWVGQLEAILGELALHAQKEERSAGALIAQGLRKIAAGIYPGGITGKVPDAENQKTLAAQTASNGRSAEPEGAWWGTSAGKGWWDSAVGTVDRWFASTFKSMRDPISPAPAPPPHPPPPPPPEPTPLTPKVQT